MLDERKEDVVVEVAVSDLGSERWLFYGGLFVFLGYILAQLAILALAKSVDLKSWSDVPKMICVAFTPACFMGLGVFFASLLRKRGSFFGDVCMFRNWRFYYPFEGMAVEAVLFIPFTLIGMGAFWFVKLISSYVPDFLSPFFTPVSPIQTVLMDVSWKGFAVVAVVAVVVSPIVEEIAFRRVFHSFVRTFLGPFGALVLTSAVFAAFHMSAVTFPPLFFLGVALQVLANYHKSIYPAIFYHAAHNTLAILFLAAMKYFELADKLPPP